MHVASCYLILRYYALGELFASANHLIFDNPLAGLSFLERAVNGFVLLGKYLSLAIFPWRLSADYSYAKITPITDLFGSPGIVELIVILCWTAATVYGVFRSRTFAFWGLWFFCSFIVTANVLIPIGTAFADRLCYLPSAAICGAFATAIAAISQTGKRLFPLGLLGTFFIVRLLYHLPFWYDDEALFSREIIISPESWKVQSNYAVHLLNAGRLDDAMHHYHLALKINPKNVKAMYGIVYVFLEKKLPTDAVHWLDKALAVKPNYVPALILLGEVYLYQEKFAEAEANFRRALELDSRNPDAISGLARARQAQKS